jgi:ubiquinone/menaquinone biosynthesis C-methylase UbiE
LFNPAVRTHPNIYTYERERRREIVLSALQAYHPSKALEAGCGPATNLSSLREILNQDSANVLVGLDFHLPSLQKAQEQLGRQQILVQARAQEIPFTAQSFDMIIALGLIGYIDPIECFFGEAHRVLRPGGAFVFSYPNDDSLYRRTRDALRRLRARPEVRIPAIALKSKTIEKVAQECGFDIQTSHFITFGLGIINFPWSIALSKFLEAALSGSRLAGKLGLSCVCTATKRLA